MKKLLRILSPAALITCLTLAGCSKAKDDNASRPAGKSASSDAPVTLRVKWIVGKRYLEKMSMHQTMEMTVPGTDKPMQTDTDMDMDYSLSALKERPGGGAEVEMKFLAEKISSSMAGRVLMSFDSATDAAGDAANPAAPLLRKMIGAHVKFLFNAAGKIDEVQGFDDFMKQITSGAPASSQMMFKGMFSEESLKQFGGHLQGLPEKPVKVGDTWPIQINTGETAIGILNLNLSYKFEGWEQHNNHNCVILTYTGKITSQPATNSSAMKMSIDDGKITGKGWFDPEMGTMVDTAADQSMAMKMVVQGSPMNSLMKQQVSAKLAKIEDITQ